VSVHRFALERAGDGGLLRASGELTFETAVEALAAGERLLASADDAGIDLSGVREGDSAGLAVLVEWLAGKLARGGSLTYAGMPAQMRSIARICGLEEMLLPAAHSTRPAAAGDKPRV
jgi:phospholipid transport system transporter-binding protein